MKYIKVINISEWMENNIHTHPLTLNNFYLFPYIIFDNFKLNPNWRSPDSLGMVNPDINRWTELEFIGKQEWLYHTKFNESKLDLIIELLESNDEANQLIALTIYELEIKREK